MNRRVALIIETSSVYGRELLSGIVRYMDVVFKRDVGMTPGEFRDRAQPG